MWPECCLLLLSSPLGIGQCLYGHLLDCVTGSFMGASRMWRWQRKAWEAAPANCHQAGGLLTS